MKWEYLTITLEYSGWELPNYDKVTFNELGAQGWELVSVVQRTEDMPQTAYFKRVKAE